MPPDVGKSFLRILDTDEQGGRAPVRRGWGKAGRLTCNREVAFLRCLFLLSGEIYMQTKLWVLWGNAYSHAADLILRRNPVFQLPGSIW